MATRTKKEATPKVITKDGDEEVVAYRAALQRMAEEMVVQAGGHPFQVVNNKPFWFYHLPLEIRPYFVFTKSTQTKAPELKS